MFVNISNHPSAKWAATQLESARQLGGDVRDIQFPNVPADADESAILEMADQLAGQVAEGDVVMAQGEFSLTYAVTTLLKQRGHQVVVGCSERRVVENADGSKTAVFEFARFRNVVAR